MSDNPVEPILDTLERSSEIMFGLIMALTFTCTVSVVASDNDVRTMLAAALSCNIAWGLVDGTMYVLAAIVTRERKRSLAAAIKESSPENARRLLLENLPDGAGKVFDTLNLDRMVEGVRAMPLGPASVTPTWDDLRGAGAIFLLVFFSTFPVAAPFLFMEDVSSALRTSNAIAVFSLFLVGMALGRHMSWPRPWVVGLAVALFGAILVAVTIALGG